MKHCDKILIVEDDAGIRRYLKSTLTAAGYDIVTAGDGRGALALISSHCPDCILLDLGLPDMDGVGIIEGIRRWSSVPIIVISARIAENDKAEALDLGADDYLTKPFHLEELAARIRCLTLRRFTQSDVVLTCGRLSFDTKARTASVGCETMSLTRKETGILEYLMLNQGRPVSQEELIEHVWDSSVNSFSNAIRVHIS